jgi:hypothetical protein
MILPWMHTQLYVVIIVVRTHYTLHSAKSHLAELHTNEGRVFAFYGLTVLPF